MPCPRDCRVWKPLGQCRPLHRCLQQLGQQRAGRALGRKESVPRVGPETLREGLKPAGGAGGLQGSDGDTCRPPRPVFAPSGPLPCLCLPLAVFPSCGPAPSQLRAPTVPSSHPAFLWLTLSHCLPGQCFPRTDCWGTGWGPRERWQRMPTVAGERVASSGSKVNPFSKGDYRLRGLFSHFNLLLNPRLPSSKEDSKQITVKVTSSLGSSKDPEPCM